jgi:hypothetical protein
LPYQGPKETIFDMKIAKRTSRAVAVLVACIMGLVVGVAAPAQAGIGNVPYWSSLPILQQGRYSGSNLVKFWQRIVWSDVATGQTCAVFTDGGFGPNTDAKTRTWQSTFGIEVDGSVGSQTWSRAQSNLRLDSTSTGETPPDSTGAVKKSTWLYYTYRGKRATFLANLERVEVWRGSVLISSGYEAWEFHNCSGNWTAVTW